MVVTPGRREGLYKEPEAQRQYTHIHTDFLQRQFTQKYINKPKYACTHMCMYMNI